MSRAKTYNYLVGGTAKGKHSSIMGSAQSVNLYPEQSGDLTYLASLSGIKFVQELLAQGGPCRGSWVSSVGLTANGGAAEMFAVFGANVYRITETLEVSIIGQVSETGRCVFAESGGLRAQLLIADGKNLWRYDLLEGGSLVQLQLPNRVTGNGGTIMPTHVAVVSGSICVNDSGSGFVYYSVPYPLNSETRTVFKVSNGEVVYKTDGITVDTEDLDSDKIVFLDNYQTQQYFNAESSSDKVNAIVAVGDLLYLFGPSTVEIWQRGSAEYETWVRTSYTANASNGCAAPYSVAVIDSTVYYIAAGQAFAKCIMSVTGSTFTPISDQWLDEKLIAENTSSSYGFAYAQGNHRFYVLQLGNNVETWCYDGATKVWHQRTSRKAATTDKETQWRVSGMQYFVNKFWAFADGSLYNFNVDYWYEDYDADTRLPMIRHRTSPVWCDNYGYFVIESVSVECNCGTWADHSLSPKLLLEISKDGGNTYGNIHAASLGTAGQYAHRVIWHALGRNRLCVLRLTYAHPTDLVLSSAEVVATSTSGVL